MFTSIAKNNKVTERGVTVKGILVLNTHERTKKDNTRDTMTVRVEEKNEASVLPVK
jgi:mannose/fructose/N-acetylgalactosamine-specific phosphotransferase system component IIB